VYEAKAEYQICIENTIKDIAESLLKRPKTENTTIYILKLITDEIFY